MALLKEIQVPLIAVNDTSLTVVELHFSTGAKVSKGDIIMVFETSKTTYDVEAEVGGYIQYLCEADRDYAVNEVVARIFSDVAEVQSLPSGQSGLGVASADPPQIVSAPARHGVGVIAPVLADPIPHWEGETLFSAEAARLMAASGIGASAFAGRDFVNKWDVLVIQESAREGGTPARTSDSKGGTRTIASGLPPAARSVAPRAVPSADLSKVIVEKLSSGKKREIEYLSEVQSTGLTSTIHVFVETEDIFTHINRSLQYFKDSLLPVIIYEASRLLKEFPLLNAYFSGEGIARYREVNTGFAIDIDKGLKVLKIAGAELKNVSGIEEEILHLSGRYLDDTLEVGDLTDITFTITDLSSEGVALFRPLINKMNSSILGISSIDKKLDRCTLSLTFDHRVTEGKSAARFLKELKDRLESYRAKDAGRVSAIACFRCYKTLKEDLSETGFARCVTPEGKEGYICQSCLKGF